MGKKMIFENYVKGIIKVIFQDLKKKKVQYNKPDNCINWK